MSEYFLEITENTINLYIENNKKHNIYYPKCYMFFDGGLSDDDELNDEYNCIKKINDSKNEIYTITRRMNEYYEILSNDYVIRNIDTLYIKYNYNVYNSFLLYPYKFNIKFENIKHIIAFNNNNEKLFELNNIKSYKLPNKGIKKNIFVLENECYTTINYLKNNNENNITYFFN